MKYSCHRKLLCELSKLSKLNGFILLEYWTNTDASILVYEFRSERTGFYSTQSILNCNYLSLHYNLASNKLTDPVLKYPSTKDIKHKIFNSLDEKATFRNLNIILPSNCYYRKTTTSQVRTASPTARP